MESLFNHGSIVKNLKTNQTGVVCYSYNPLEDIENVPVAYRDKTFRPSVENTNRKNLELYSPSEKEILTKEHIKNVCKEGTEQKCSYLFYGPLGETVCFATVGNEQDLDRIVRLAEARVNCEGRFKTFLPER